MSIHDCKTLVPGAYPALEAEAYRAAQEAPERETEPPPAPPAVIWDTPRMARPTLVPLPWGSL
jgi:hypothetical protein